MKRNGDCQATDCTFKDIFIDQPKLKKVYLPPTYRLAIKQTRSRTAAAVASRISGVLQTTKGRKCRPHRPNLEQTGEAKRKTGDHRFWVQTGMLVISMSVHGCGWNNKNQGVNEWSWGNTKSLTRAHTKLDKDCQTRHLEQPNLFQLGIAQRLIAFFLVKECLSNNFTCSKETSHLNDDE